MLCVARAWTYEEAISLINSSPWGDGAAIFTRDGRAARRQRRPRHSRPAKLVIHKFLPIPPHSSFTVVCLIIITVGRTGVTMRRRTTVLGALVFILLGISLTSGTAAARAPIHYVALGDSYSAGTGAGEYDPASGDCRRSKMAYPELWRQRHRVDSFTFVACERASTATVRSTQMDALSTSTTFVTITIGGNDAGFPGVLVNCILGHEQMCQTAIDRAKKFARTTLPDRLDVTYQEIAERAPAARVVVLGYPRLFELSDCEELLRADTRAALNDAADLLNDTIKHRAEAAGFHYTDARDAFAGHGVCSTNPYIHSLAVPIQESYHPNRVGQLKGYLPLVETAYRHHPHKVGS
ncbi:hypothetical protein GCM10012275_10450 [Longimycelium tulufanense]|uniref:SGNH hydrolase-type esterase domain-containing protein n=1 Tax=Longimycelium tulufanense TaxID=907463 RepID=A0A8J3CB15_9PSEU|nr:SGNH/GDSL hydrolase family protein [Longimycelium tulufanense]GGM41364.1 hypothetical protein GCM10012275_10450 [Longimycelium tulufanense]